MVNVKPSPTEKEQKGSKEFAALEMGLIILRINILILIFAAEFYIPVFKFDGRICQLWKIVGS